jgi:uncharacterized membrane protein YsdA (DUF1294 family)
MSILFLIAGWYVLASLVTFAVYAVDKAAARRGGARVAERTLHVFGFAGGWPGAIAAQAMLRHKSRKQPFRTVFWMTVTVNCGLLILAARWLV